MECSRVLVVSDSPDRRNFLEYYIKGYGMAPIWYPNIFSTRKAATIDSFSMMVVDLSIPLHTKLDTIKESCDHHPNIKVITIGKKEYLEKTAVLSECSSVISLDSIESFPQSLQILRPDEADTDH